MNKDASRQPSKRRKGVSSKLRKRKLHPPQQYDDALADDVERAEKKIRVTATILKRKSEVALGEQTLTRVRPTLLGPTLTRRFAEASNTDFLSARSSSSGGSRPMEC